VKIMFNGTSGGVVEFVVQLDEGLIDSHGSSCGYVESFWRCLDSYLQLTRVASGYGETPDAIKSWLLEKICVMKTRHEGRMAYNDACIDLESMIKSEWDETARRIQNGSVPSLGLPGGPRVLEPKDDVPLTHGDIAAETKATDLQSLNDNPLEGLLLIADGLEAALSHRLAEKIRSCVLSIQKTDKSQGLQKLNPIDHDHEATVVVNQASS